MTEGSLIQTLQKTIESQNQTIETLRKELQRSNENLEYLLKKLYGKKSEKTAVIDGQLLIGEIALGLFNEAEVNADSTVLEPVPFEEPVKRSRAGYKRKEVFKNLLDFQGNFVEVINKAKDYYTNEDMRTSLKELEDIKTYIELNGDLKNTYFDLPMVAAFDYYEGIIFKGYYPNIYQPILSGGRYDYLTERVGRKVPAVGFSIDMNELMKVIYKEGDMKWRI